MTDTNFAQRLLNSNVNIPYWFTSGIDLLAATQTLIVPVQSGKSFIPINAYIELTAVTGVLTVPVIRLGNNGSFNNVAPLLTCAGLASARNVIGIPLVAALNSIDIGTTGISVDVQTAGLVATVATGTVYLSGFIR